MMVGLQGSGKTTTTAKLAKRLTERDKRKVLMASLDINRPAAMEQLAVLGRRSASTRCRSSPARSRRRSPSARWKPRKLGGYDVVLLDTAGRTTLDEELMAEAAEIKTRRQSARSAAGRRLPDRPGRGQSRARASTSASASPASC